MTEPVPMGDARIAAVSIVECGEPLVDMRRIPELRLDPRRADPAGAYARIRKGLVERLLVAQRVVRPRLRLLLIEGYRPLAVQTRYFNDHAARLRRQHPDWTAAFLYRQASLSVAPPDLAPHVCGGAIDLTLCTVDGTELPMGTAVEASAEGACFTAAANIPAEAAANRYRLVTALTGVGLVNYPTRWWHWSYGDRYWAYRTGAPHALYGPLDSP